MAKDIGEFGWVSVYSTDPLTVRRDGETEPIGVSPQSLIPKSALKEDDRLYCQFVSRRAIILGKAKGAWPIMASGVVKVGSIGKGKNDIRTVTLPEGRFSKAPVVTYTTASPRVVPTVDDISKSSFRARLYNLTTRNASDVTMQWVAVEE